MSGAAKRLKRVFDLVVAVSGLLVFAPLSVVLWFVIRHEDGGPAIFRQERVGCGGRPFMLYKFRSMTVTAEKDGPALYVKGDKRLTKVGRFLREHHLDELGGGIPPRTPVLRRQDYGVESRLRTALRNAAGTLLECHALQRLYRYDGENARTPEDGP